MPKLSRSIHVLAAGGTIAMTPGHPGSGAAPTLDAAALVAAVPGLAVDEVRTVRSLPGVQLSLGDALEISQGTPLGLFRARTPVSASQRAVGRSPGRETRASSR